MHRTPVFLAVQNGLSASFEQDILFILADVVHELEILRDPVALTEILPDCAPWQGFRRFHDRFQIRRIFSTLCREYLWPSRSFLLSLSS